MKKKIQKIKKIIKDSERYAQKNNFRLNPDKKALEGIARGLLANEEKYDYRYCPCRRINVDQEENKKKICPCLWHQEEIKKDGHCLCRLFFQ